jgi:hypothetical protein
MPGSFLSVSRSASVGGGKKWRSTLQIYTMPAKCVHFMHSAWKK